MHKLFRPRTIRRILLLLALAFPMVYLMGTAFFALNGSHGNVLLAQEEEVVTSSKIVDFNQLVRNPLPSVSSPTYWSSNVTISDSGYGSFTPTFRYDSANCTPFNAITGHVYLGSVELKASTSDYRVVIGCGQTSTLLDTGIYSILTLSTTYSRYSCYGTYTGVSGWRYFTIMDNNAFGWLQVDFCHVNVFDLTQMYGAGNEPTSDVFRARYNADYYEYTTSTKLIEETTEAPTYSEYLFNQVFGHDNIVTQLGYYALSEEQKGFAPLSALIRFVDGNILHWGDGNALAVFSYGYVYYAMSTLIVYEIVIIATKLLLLPLKAVDVFDRKGEYDD